MMVSLLKPTIILLFSKIDCFFTVYCPRSPGFSSLLATEWMLMAILHRSAIYSQTMSLSPRSVVLFSRPIYLWWKDFSNRYHFSFWPMVPYRMATKCTTFLPSYPFPQDRNSVFCSFVDGLFANFRHDGDDLRKLKCRSPFLQ